MFSWKSVEGDEYETLVDDFCFLRSVNDQHDRFNVPSSILSTTGKRYQVVGISPHVKMSSVGVVSFDESSEVTEVRTSFIRPCTSIFILPPRIKRVRGSKATPNNNNPKIVSANGFKAFVSTCGSHIIMNHFPLEVAYEHFERHRIQIRETVRIIGDHSFYGKLNIISVSFPSSVECIGDGAFDECTNLRNVNFKANSKLKKIGDCSETLLLSPSMFLRMLSKSDSHHSANVKI